MALMDDIINQHRPDPNGILEFLINELAAAEKAGQRAWIFGHIPPGASDVMRDQVRNDISVSQCIFSLISGYRQSNYYDQIVTRYRRTIVAQFFGHTHYVRLPC